MSQDLSRSLSGNIWIKLCWVVVSSFFPPPFYWEGQYKAERWRSRRRRVMVFSRGQNRNHSTEKYVHGMHLSPLISRLSWFKDSVQFSPEYKVCRWIRYLELEWVSVKLMEPWRKLFLVLLCVAHARLLNKTPLKAPGSPWLTKQLNWNFLSRHIENCY